MRVAGSRLNRFSRWLAVVAAAICGLAAAANRVAAQSVYWENDDDQPGTVIRLVFENCVPDKMPEVPNVPAASFRYLGQGTQIQQNNMTVTERFVLSYVVQPRQSGSIEIPEFTVSTKKGPMKVPAFTVGRTNISADNIANAKLIPSRTSVWAGEVFTLTYKLSMARRYNPSINEGFAWNPAPLVVEEWSKGEVDDSSRTDMIIQARTRAYAKVPNTIKLEAASILLNIQSGNVAFGWPLQARMQPVSVVSDQPTIEIRPLPTPPAGFTGAVGQFKLTSKIVPQQASVGDPITWTVELTGTGNWPDIEGLPSREVSKDFTVVQPKAKRTPAEGKLFDATLSEDVVLVPTKAGRYTLGPLKFIYFDPQSGSYQTLTTDTTTVTISAPANATPPVPAAPASGNSTSSSTSTAPTKPLTAPAAPAGIPRSPLPGQATAAAPLRTPVFIAWLVAPLAGLVLFWFTLALRRARATDPLRPQREARERLGTLLAELRTAASAGRVPTSTQLLQWQHDTAILWELRHAAPSAAAINDIEWSALWREADSALYGARQALPSDWIARAEAALAGKRVPPFRPFRLFLPRNLLPIAAAIALSAVLVPMTLRAASPEAEYNAGNFTGAEQAWRESVANRPTDWIARHNLALALMQQDRFGEATAEAAAAFVQHPDDRAVRWHFNLAAEKAGFAPTPLLPFLKEGPAAEIGALASPAGWQRILILAAFVVATALAWMLWNTYGKRSRLQFWLAGFVGALAFGIGAVAIFGYVAYGETADERAVIAWRSGTLRSIPTEADTTQKTTTLAAGSVALVDKTFLKDWVRLRFANGQTGWVRKSEVISLWRGL